MTEREEFVARLRECHATTHTRALIDAAADMLEADAQRLDIEKREATSFMWASFGGKCMVKRKQEKPLLDNERSLLEDEMQPALFKGDTPSLTH